MLVKKHNPIPLWVNLMQALLIAIMLSQVYMYFFNHDMMEATGVTLSSNPMLNLVYEMGARTFVMIVASVYVMINQNAKQYLVVLIMNIIREGQEMIIDPMFPVINAPVSPTVDFWIHVVIVGIEIWAFITVYSISKIAHTRVSY